MSIRSVSTSRPVTIAVLMVSALALVNAIVGPGLIMIGLLVAGPCLAAVSGRPRSVLAVGAYATLLALALSWWPTTPSSPRATGRATGLTRQLLVFASGEPQRSTTFDLNRSVGEAEPLLAYTIG